MAHRAAFRSVAAVVAPFRQHCSAAVGLALAVAGGWGTAVVACDSNAAAAASLPPSALELWSQFQPHIVPHCRNLKPREVDDVALRLYEHADEHNTGSSSGTGDKNPAERAAAAAAALAVSGTPVFRAAEVIIRAPVATASKYWVERQQWDPAHLWTVHTVLNRSPPAGGGKLLRVTTARKPMISEPREFILHVRKIKDPPGAKPGSVAYVYGNCSELLPHVKKGVRGEANAVLLLEPYTTVSSRCVYAFDMNFKGVLPTIAFEGAADAEASAILDLSRFIDAELHGHP